MTRNAAIRYLTTFTSAEGPSLGELAGYSRFDQAGLQRFADTSACGKSSAKSPHASVFSSRSCTRSATQPVRFRFLVGETGGTRTGQRDSRVALSSLLMQPGIVSDEAPCRGEDLARATPVLIQNDRGLR